MFAVSSSKGSVCLPPSLPRHSGFCFGRPCIFLMGFPVTSVKSRVSPIGTTVSPSPAHTACQRAERGL